MADTPRLDKFVMRGYTTSSGNSSGSWVSREQSSQPVSANRMDSQSGSSFTMGGAGQAYKSKSSGPDYSLAPEFGNNGRSTSRRYFGRTSKDGKEKEKNTLHFDVSRLITGDGLASAELSENTKFIKGALIILVVIAVAYYYYRSQDDGSLRRPVQKNGVRAVSQSVTSHPAWARE